MRIAIASDHAGFELKESLVTELSKDGYEVLDLGPENTESVDYPVFAEAVANKVSDDQDTVGVVVCGSGVGVAIAANKVDGIRAVNAHDVQEAEMSRRHNNANVVTLAGRKLQPQDAKAIVETFLQTEFEGGRHTRRVEQIAEIERHN